ncbi:MAG: stage II sporulation protein P [Lachnospiraceae bacterium]|nr:stage II sporulation protein P [Lachnospiraceae bacterium]
MWGKRLLVRTAAKYRAARYGGKPKRKWSAKEYMRTSAVIFLLIGLGVLYVKELPLFEFPKEGYELLKTLDKNLTGEEEEALLPVQYASTAGVYLAVSKAAGEIPEYIPPVEEVKPVFVREILEERFGNLTETEFRSFLNNYYIEDVSTKASEEIFSLAEFADYELTIEKKDEPQILIFHTHGSEGYADSREGVAEDTVVGAGELLAKELRETYGYNVIHETTLFDRKPDGSDDRNNAYNNALPVITDILERYPSVEVVIDLHRDSGEARTSVINGVSTAKVMLFNGLCRTKDGPITYYSNPNLKGNLAFSLHLQITGNELYPGLMHRIYLKSYRYNMHLKEKYILVELGTHKNTVAEAKAAMVPFAETIATVLSKEKEGSS